MKKVLALTLLLAMLCTFISCGEEEHKHSPVQIAAVSATCTESGNSEYYSCSECGKLFSDAKCLNETSAEEQRLAPTGHSWTDANCTDPKTCSVCKATEGEPLGHVWGESCDPTCNRAGCEEVRKADSHLDSNEDDICDKCNESVSSNVSTGNGDGEFLPTDRFD
jgi:hypothetical protein